jgi:hypothetical protein
MRVGYVLLLGVSVSLLTALPASAYQSAGGQHNGMAADQSAPLNQPSRDMVYGSQLMTPAERSSYRHQMLKMKTVKERETLRKQHHDLMQKRAAERGMTLPDMPPRQGTGMGHGMHMGQGAGQGMHRGSGMGHGTGMHSGSDMPQSTPPPIEQQPKNQGEDRKTQQKQPAEQGTPSSNDGGKLPS